MSEQNLAGAAATELDLFAGDVEAPGPVPTPLVSPEALDALVEEDEDALLLSPVTSLEDPQAGTEAGRNPTRGED